MTKFNSWNAYNEEYKKGEQLAKEGKFISDCENDAQRSGFWSMKNRMKKG